VHICDRPLRRCSGLSITYYVNVHAVLSMNKDLIVKLPFIISGTERKEGTRRGAYATRQQRRRRSRLAR